MKLLSVAYKFITASLICQAVMLSTLLPARPLPKSPPEQALAQQALKAKLEKLGTKLGDLKKNLGSLKQKLQNLKSALPKGAPTTTTSTPPSTTTTPSTPRGTPPETGGNLDNTLKMLSTLGEKALANKLAKMEPKKLNRLSKKIGDNPTYQDLKKAIDAVLAGKPATPDKPQKPVTKPPISIPSFTAEELLEKGKGLKKGESTTITPIQDLIIQIEKTKNETERKTILEPLTSLTLEKILETKFPEGYTGTKFTALFPAQQNLVTQVQNIMKQKEDPAWQSLPQRVVDNSKNIKRGLSKMVVQLGDDIAYVFALTAGHKASAEHTPVIDKINIEGQSRDTLFILTRSVINDVKGTGFMNALHKRIIDTWLANMKIAILTGSPEDARGYLIRTLDLCDENRSNEKPNKVDFLPDPKSEIEKIFKELVDNQKAKGLAEAGLARVQEIKADKTGK